MNTNNWVEQFTELWKNRNDGGQLDTTKEEFIDFIYSLLSTKEQEVKKEIREKIEYILLHQMKTLVDKDNVAWIPKNVVVERINRALSLLSDNK